MFAVGATLTRRSANDHYRVHRKRPVRKNWALFSFSFCTALAS